jgi:two-component sensor histidine kinase
VERQELLAARVLPTSDPVLSLHRLPLQPLPRSVGEARRFVASHVPALPADAESALLLLTSELVTNAVLHARTDVDVSVVVAEQSVVVMVHDEDLALSGSSPSPQREGGWGLGLVSALAESSAMTTHPGDGKTAWFRVLRGPVRAVADNAARRAQDRREEEEQQ